MCPRVAELNPYVHVDMSSSDLHDNTDLTFLSRYQVSDFFKEVFVSNKSKLQTFGMMLDYY